MFALVFSCPADYVPDWQPRILLGMVEARTVNAFVSVFTLSFEAAVLRSIVLRYGTFNTPTSYQ